ncbi:cation:dicarboxylase symporter family transporter [Bradyrhizobium sp. UFLA05-153]
MRIQGCLRRICSRRARSYRAARGIQYRQVHSIHPRRTADRALSTSSSESALPRLMSKLKAAGCPESVVGVVVPAGATPSISTVRAST